MEIETRLLSHGATQTSDMTSIWKLEFEIRWKMCLFKFILTIAFFRLPQFEKYTSGVVSKSFGDHLGAKIAQRQQEPTYVSNT